MSSLVIEDITIPENGIQILDCVCPDGELFCAITKPIKGVEAPLAEKISGSKLKLVFDVQDAGEKCSVKVSPKKHGRDKPGRSGGISIFNSTQKCTRTVWVACIFFVFSLGFGVYQFHTEGSIDNKFTSSLDFVRRQFNDFWDRLKAPSEEEIIEGTKDKSISIFSLNWKKKHKKPLHDVYGKFGEYYVRYKTLGFATLSTVEDQCEEEEAFVPSQDILEKIYQSPEALVAIQLEAPVWTSTKIGWDDRLLFLPKEKFEPAYREIKAIEKGKGPELDLLGKAYDKVRKIGVEDEEYKERLRALALRKYKLHSDTEVYNHRFQLDDGDLARGLCVIAADKVE